MMFFLFVSVLLIAIGQRHTTLGQERFGVGGFSVADLEMMRIITVYGREGCAQCANTMRALDIAGLAARYVDVDVDQDAAAMLRERGVQQLPYVETSTGDTWAGLRLDKIIELRLALLSAA